MERGETRHAASPAALRKRYLFIRILEACNAECFMCQYAGSRDPYRFTLAEFASLLPQASSLGVRFVRLTGGEPLLHKELEGMIHAGAAAGMGMSVITNGQFLPRMIDSLCRAGLRQVVVSVDGAVAETHDCYRHTAGLFDRCIAGLEMARERGVLTRVNTVVGPHNYVEMPQLQERLTALGVSHWELSPIKLERPIVYADPDHVRSVCDPLYEAEPSRTLVPLGKRFYGDTQEEQRLFFESSIAPRPTPPLCHLVGDVIYLDAKAGRGFGCSLLPHRRKQESGGGVQLRTNGRWKLDLPQFRQHFMDFRTAGPRSCTGCSTTAAGYSDAVQRGSTPGDWDF